ncbi:MAG: phosphatidylserine decarboxylase family protein [Mailhella sp.]|nr:phosphatidylserine decarboxylase family protein [Mailhella sp.]
MRSASAGIAPEGFPIIGLLAVTAAVFGMLGWSLPAGIVLVLLWFSVWFFRDPERVTPTADGIAVSPADGKIILITKAADPIYGAECTRISVFMNIFSVHVNRAPVSGDVKAIRYFPGKFFNASLDKASEDNERCAYAMQDADGRSWVFVQIAGLIARRIVCRAEEGDHLTRGGRFGLIRFGSRMDVYLPSGYVPSVGIGDEVFAGLSVIAARSGDAAGQPDTKA